MKTFVKRWSMVLVVIMIIMSFAACGKTSKTPSTSTTPSTKEAESTKDGEQAISGEVTLFAWLPDNPEIVENWANGFKAKYPNVKIHTQMMTGQGLAENLEPRFAAGTVPDVFSFELDAFCKSQVKAGKVADIGDTKSWDNQVDAMKAAWTYDGVKYGISGGVCTTLFFYNKDMFNKAGITEMPKNWDEFLDMCEKLKKDGTTPLVWYGGFPNMLSNGPLSWGLGNDVWANESDVFDKIENEVYDFTKNPGWVKMYEKMKTLDDRGYLLEGFMSTDYQGGVDQFNAGKAAMIFAGTWQAAYLIDKGGFDTGLMLPPWNDAGKELVTLNASETGWSVGKGDNEKLGKLLIDYMFYEDFATYQNPRGCVSPFKETKDYILDKKLADAMDLLNTYPKFVDLFGRNLPSALSTEARTLAQNIYIDIKPSDIPELLGKVQKSYIDTK
jgi:multiple sugar transport system substrate-binding protein